MISILVTVLAGLLGAAFGSFLNVCLTRWAAGESIVAPRSHCRSCGRVLTWWENIPLASWIVLRGRCRTCKAWIGWRYPVVEFSVAASWAVLSAQAMSRLEPILTSGLSDNPPDAVTPLSLLAFCLTTCGTMLLVWLLTGLAALDAEHLWLPDVVTLPGILLGVLFSLLRAGGSSLQLVALLDQLLRIAIDMVIAAGLILLIRWIYWILRRHEGIGLGDAKLMALLAAWLGLPGALLSFVLGVVLGAIVGLSLLPRARRLSQPLGLTRLPLGTFLSIGGIVAALWGPRILAAYLRWSGLS